MPELPDIEVYLRALEERVAGKVLEKIRMQSMFLLRTVDPPLAAFEGEAVTGLSRLGKRIVFRFEDKEPEPQFLVLHLMIAGRLHWKEKGAKPHGRTGLCAFDFPDGTLTLTEAGTKKRAKLHALRGADALAEHDPGGVDVMAIDADGLKAVMTRRNHTLKRALTDPRLLSGIGNAFSDEILLEARLSPVKQTQKLPDETWPTLLAAIHKVLDEWTALLDEQRKGKFPEKVTAFRKEMGAHGKYGEPCPNCGTKIQRIVYAKNETNYCPACQNGGKLLADRALSRLLKQDWPKTLEELEELKASHQGDG